MVRGQTVAQPHRQLECLGVVHCLECSTHAHQYTITDSGLLFSDKLLVEAVAWSPNGLYITSAGGSPDVWNATTGKHIYTYRGHSLIVYAVAWSPKSLRVASASADGTV